MKVVYIMVKTPITRPNVCKIGLSDSLPSVEDGWTLFSSIESDDAVKAFERLNKTVQSLPAPNMVNDTILVPVSALDKWMVNIANGLMSNENIKSVNARQSNYVRYVND